MLTSHDIAEMLYMVLTFVQSWPWTTLIIVASLVAVTRWWGWSRRFAWRMEAVEMAHRAYFEGYCRGKEETNEWRDDPRQADEAARS
jgi:hypothetical protein